MSNVVRSAELSSTQGFKVLAEGNTSLAKRSRPTFLLDGRRASCPLRLGIADDHAIVREGLKDVLSGLPDIEVVGEAADGRAAIELARKVEMDVFLMDLSMPKKGGLEALGSLRAQFPDLSVLIVSGFPEEQYAPALLRLGAAGFVGKGVAPEELIEAIRAVGSGKHYWSPNVTSILATHLHGPQLAQLHDALTSREFQVLLRLGRGETVGAVGRSLGLSHKTVSTHRTRLMRKLALASNSDLTYYAVKNRLLE
ncbi:response regulator [Variovorax sp. GB1R11]|uniref:response regulator n=1 Tax=Variovorax sp. GB1R11 TaxID=3443741 RepID=UPI003F446D24